MTDLTQLDNAGLANLWNQIAKVFDGAKKETTEVGILQLSRETERRNLELVQNKFGKIVLEERPTKCSKCGDEGWLYGQKGGVRKCNCK
jgi:hypothetical protein